MLNFKDCLRKAQRNKTFILHDLIKVIDKFPDWITIVAFYSALHFVDAHLIKHHNIQNEHHEERERDVATYLLDIYPAYKRLYDMGLRSRYLRIEDNPTPDEADSAVKYDLPEIEEYVMQHMA